LESSRVLHVKDESDPRVAALEKATVDLAAWRPNMEGMLDASIRTSTSW
jgi:hypothetical protein